MEEVPELQPQDMFFWITGHSSHSAQVAQRHHCLGLQRKCLLAWLQHTQEILAGKMARAEEFCSCMLLRRGFRSWLKVSSGQKAGDVISLSTCSCIPEPSCKVDHKHLQAPGKLFLTWT